MNVWVGALAGLLLPALAGAAVPSTQKPDDLVAERLHELQLARSAAGAFLDALRSGDEQRLHGLLVVPAEERLKDKVMLEMARRAELMAGRDLYEELLDPGRIREDWGLFVTLQRRPKADRNKVKLSSLLLHRDDDGAWQVVPKLAFSDPGLNIAHDDDAQSLLRWYRSNERKWRRKFVTPLLGGGGLPDAMRHLVTAPRFDLEHLRDPFASYLDLVARHNEQMLQRRMAERRAARPKEPLEAFDLSTLRLVAVYTIHGTRVAMVEDNEGKGHTIHVGDYMGKYSGRVTAIDEAGIHLLEEVVNPKGKLVHKKTLLAFTTEPEEGGE